MVVGSIIFISFLIAFCYLLFNSTFYKELEIPKYWTAIALGVKLFATACLYIIYTYYYSDRSSADIFKYYDDAISIEKMADSKLEALKIYNPFANNLEREKFLKNTQHWDPPSKLLINDNRTITTINLLLLFISGGFYPIHALFFCLFSFLGLLAFYYFFKVNTKLNPKLLFILTFISPSLMLWTSGILKESWLFFCLGFTLYLLQKIRMKFSYKSLFYLLLFILLLLAIKQYLILFLIPLFFIHLLPKINYKLLILVFTIVYTTCFIFFEFPLEILQMKLNEFNLLAIEGKANSYFHIEEYSNKWNYLKAIPTYLFNVFIRPAIPSSFGFFAIINCIESIALIALIPIALIYRETKLNKALILTILFFLISTSILIGSTVPIIGAIVRYRVVLIPFYLIFIASFYPNKVLNKFKL